MQSIFRKQRRIDSGQQNPMPNSTKIAKNTDNGSKKGLIGYRKGRFKVYAKPLYLYQIHQQIIKSKLSVKELS